MKDIIVALDVDTDVKVYNLIQGLEDRVEWYKVGAVLFTKYGPELIRTIKTKYNKKVMLDLKYHDIPNTVNLACEHAANMCVDMCTIHLSGGKDMIAAAVEGAEKGSMHKLDFSMKILGISVLTSMSEQDLRDIGVHRHDMINLQVDKLVSLGVSRGIHGVVCSPLETEGIREIHGDYIQIVNPGVRVGESSDDQKRKATPKEAFDAGADFVVMGRQVYDNPDPLGFIKKVQEEL